MSEEKKELNVEALSEENLDDVSGGAVFYAGKWAGDEAHPYEVLDDASGNVTGRVGTMEEAKAAAKRQGQSTVRYYRMSTVGKKRDAYKQYMKYKDLDKFDNPY